MKKVAVLFSGGLDSTYLVYKNLMDGNTVHLIMLEITNNESKVKTEKIAYNKLKSLLEEEFETSLDSTTFEFGVLNKSVDYYEYKGMFLQMPLFLSSLAFIPVDIEEIQIAYCDGDDAALHIDNVRRAINGMNAILKKEVVVAFPLLNAKKTEYVKVLPQQYINSLVWCENPSVNNDGDDRGLYFHTCGFCSPCRKYKQYRSDGIFDIITDNEIYTPNCETGFRSGVHSHIDDIRKVDPEIKRKCYLYHYNEEPVVDEGEFAGVLKMGEVHSY